MPVSDHSGCGIDFGTVRFSDSGYTGLVGPVKGYVGYGLNVPVSGSTLDTILGGMKLRRGFVLLCSTLCSP